MYLLASSLAAAAPAERRVSARRGWAGENDGLFEHPAAYSVFVNTFSLVSYFAVQN
jgi:hypothetical protein